MLGIISISHLSPAVGCGTCNRLSNKILGNFKGRGVKFPIAGYCDAEKSRSLFLFIRLNYPTGIQTVKDYDEVMAHLKDNGMDFVIRLVVVPFLHF